MTYLTVNPSTLQGKIIIPSSKSHTLRAIIFGLLGNGKTVIHSPLLANDSYAMIDACRLLGAKISLKDSILEIDGINGEITHAEDVIDAGNSGLVLRFCSAIGALCKRPVVITGDHSIRYQRPMKPLLSALTNLGAHVSSLREEGYAPVIIQGPLKGGVTKINGQDSQPVSALLIAASLSEGPTTILVENPGEKPWISLTLDWLDKLKIPYYADDFTSYHLPGKARFEAFSYAVPGDFSSAAFSLGAALITGSFLTLHNLDMQDVQGDKKIIPILQRMGASIEIHEKNKTLYVKPGAYLQGIHIDINDCIDAIALLAVVACFAEGETHLTNAFIARKKECDRLACITLELRKMGADIIEKEDALIIRKSSLKGTTVYSHEDHRMAMALAVAALGAKGSTTILSTECIAKTYPSFVSDFQKISASIHEVKNGK